MEIEEKAEADDETDEDENVDVVGDVHLSKTAAGCESEAFTIAEVVKQVNLENQDRFFACAYF